MPVAVVDFEAKYGGDVIRLTAGESWVVDGHELHRRFPANFQPDVPPMGARKVTGRRSGRRGSATAPPPAGTSPSVQDGLPELRTLRRYELEITAAGWYDIDMELGVSDDGRETAIALYGDRDDKQILIDRAVGPGDAYRTRDRIELDWEHWLRAERAWQRSGYWGRLMGFAHTHPEGNILKPSDADLRTWAGAIDERIGAVTGGVFVGVILGRDSYWAPLDVKAWTVSRRDGLTICEPPHVEIGTWRS